MYFQFQCVNAIPEIFFTQWRHKTRDFLHRNVTNIELKLATLYCKNGVAFSNQKVVQMGNVKGVS